MKITYIYHSGFLVELDECILIFDYYRGELPHITEGKPIIVFASHFHPDHYSIKIFEKLKEKGLDCQAILSKDISPMKYPEDVKITKVSGGKSYSLDCGLKLETLYSTDSGVAYIVETNEGAIYHAGDLNDWYWDEKDDNWNKQMTGQYRAEIKKIKGKKFKAAFVPLDSRQGEHYKDGMLYFLQNTDCEAVYPMHYWERPEVIDSFVSEYPQFKSIIKNTEMAKGDII